MVKTELVKRSPLRILEKSIHGGLQEGHLGIIAAYKGEGKTACVVHLATDKLLQGKHVVHVSFEVKTTHIMDWYETIFREISEKRSLESAVDVHDEIIKNRVILNFNQSAVDAPQVIASIEALISQGNFGADLVVVDGYDFSHGDPAFLTQLKEFCGTKNLALWATADVDKIGQGFPAELKGFEALTSVLIDLEPKEDYTQLTLRKDYDRAVNESLHLILEPRTLLIVEE
ncbi:MAG: AAA family ATPase [Spirochaetales bacterium]|nr:AAA family ATPase [Spirochaetales bacterium]